MIKMNTTGIIQVSARITNKILKTTFVDFLIWFKLEESAKSRSFLFFAIFVPPSNNRTIFIELLNNCICKNDWFQSSLYISNTNLYSLQALLDHVQRNIEVMANNPSLGLSTAQYMNSMPKEYKFVLLMNKEDRNQSFQ